MVINIGSKQVLKILYIIAWIIFIGLCIEAGGIIFNAVVTFIRTPSGAKNLWMDIDLVSLYAYDRGYFLALSFIISIVLVMKALMFYHIVKILHDDKLDLHQPFSHEVYRFILKLSYMALGIGLFSLWGSNISKWFITMGVAMPDVQSLRIAGADVWLFMGIILLVIAQIVKRGIDIQSENDLTI